MAGGGKKKSNSGLAGQVVVITGAARGLGEQLAVRLAEKGARLALVGLEPDRLAAVAGACGPDAAWWEADVTDGTRMSEVAQEIAARFGRVDVLVSNAGIGAGGPLASADPEIYDRVIEVNLLGSIRTVRAFLPHLIASKGYLLQVASLAALLPAPLMSAYGVSKAGVDAFVQAIRPELYPSGVSVGVAYLSWTDTDMVRGADEIEPLRRVRADMPFPLNKVYPLGPTVDRLVAGIARRSPQIYGQPWLRVVPLLRGVAPAMIFRQFRRQAAELAAAIRDAGPEASLPVGAGGAADAEAHRNRSAAGGAAAPSRSAG